MWFNIILGVACSQYFAVYGHQCTSIICFMAHMPICITYNCVINCGLEVSNVTTTQEQIVVKGPVVHFNSPRF